MIQGLLRKQLTSILVASILAVGNGSLASAQVTASDAGSQVVERSNKPPLADGYILGAGDIIEVAVVGRDEYKARVQIQVDGTVQLPKGETRPHHWADEAMDWDDFDTAWRDWMRSIDMDPDDPR